jgi:hypothetical protein
MIRALSSEDLVMRGTVHLDEAAVGTLVPERGAFPDRPPLGAPGRPSNVPVYHALSRGAQAGQPVVDDAVRYKRPRWTQPP